MSLRIVCWLLAGVVSLVQAEPLPGEYITAGGWGHLTVKKSGAGQSFNINALGGNGHSCQLSGGMSHGTARLAAQFDDTAPACVVTLTPVGRDVEVKNNGEASCRDWCGMRAVFEGRYLAVDPACTDRQRAATRKRFKQHYDQKAWGQAQAVLAPLLARCSKTMDWIETGWVRNDLALASAKAKDRAACLAALEPLAGDAAKTDEEVLANYPPTDAELYHGILKATRTNLGLCRRLPEQ